MHKSFQKGAYPADDTRATFAIQILTALLSILLATAVIFLFWYIGDQMDWRTDDPYNFWVFDLMVGGIFTFFVTTWTPRYQFNSALGPKEVFKEVFQSLVFFWILCVLIYHGSFQFFTSRDIWFSFQVIIFSTGVLFSLALVIGFAQAFLLHITGFNKQLHLYRISNAVALQACRRGKLPYREKIRLLGSTSFTTVVFLSMVVMIFMFPHNDNCLNIVMSGIFLLFLVIPFLAIKMLRTRGFFLFRGQSQKHRDLNLAMRELLTWFIVNCKPSEPNIPCGSL